VADVGLGAAAQFDHAPIIMPLVPSVAFTLRRAGTSEPGPLSPQLITNRITKTRHDSAAATRTSDTGQQRSTYNRS
jgi:hypothetical protein